MLYLCTGMPRSGSTWLFNAARLVLKHAVLPDFVSGSSLDRKELLKHETVLLKIHRFDPELAAKADVVLTSHRDLRDIAASAYRKFEVDFSTAKVATWVKNYMRWVQIAAYDLHYEDLLNDRPGQLRRLASVLRLSPQTLGQMPFDVISQEIDGATFKKKAAGESAHDSENMLHKGHITDGRHGSWQGVAPEAFLADVEKEFRGWMADRGYLPAPKEASFASGTP